MTTPYEPVMRHEWGPGAVICGPCQAQIIPTACGSDWCTCSCTKGGVTAVPAIPSGPITTISTSTSASTTWVDPPAKVRTEDDFPEFRKVSIPIAAFSEPVDLWEGMSNSDIADQISRDEVLNMEQPVEVEWHGGKATPILAGVAVAAGAAGFWESGFALPAAMVVLGITLFIVGIRLRRNRA